MSLVMSRKIHVPDITFISCRDDLAFDVIGYTYVIINDVASAANSKYSISLHVHSHVPYSGTCMLYNIGAII